MVVHPHPIDRLIAAACEKRSKAEADKAQAERDARDAQIKIDALEEAKALMLKQAGNASERSQSHTGNGARRRRSLSGTWQEILRKMDQRGESNFDAIERYSSEAGLEITRESLRGQMFNYVKRGLLVRPRQGVFRVTPEGRKAAGVKSWPGNGDAPTDSAEAS